MTHRRRGGPSRLGTFFFLLGCLAVLAVTFAAGVLTGRYSARQATDRPTTTSGDRDAAVKRSPEALSPEARSPEARSPEARSPEARSAEARARGSETGPDALPKLTFYQELTAPLGSDGTRSGRARPGKAADRSARSGAPDPPAAALPPRGPERPDGSERFTVQVGAYRTRPPAEALRATLATAGHEAYVSEVPGAGEARFRVRVGSYPSREAAREATARLTAERPLAAFVTVR